MRALCLADNHGQLKETQFTQPALYTVNALHFWDRCANGARPEFLAGHSLGEYNALWAAGVFDFITGLRLVAKRGQLMASVKDGAMAAVIGLDALRIARALRASQLESIDIANFNSPEQTVISGSVGDLLQAAPVLEKAGAGVVIPLPVSAAFHSRYMKAIARVFKEYLSTFEFRAPSIPVVSNVTGGLYPSEPSAIKSLLVAQMYLPVRWTESVEYLVDRCAPQFEEVGPGSVLTKFVQKIASNGHARAIARR
jgi:trans-AT polyketide synthase/acyltransferase/oxidoreductase domain-containing protein/rhizoxin biosynthesis acyltransferase